MVKVEFLGPIEKEPVELDINSLKELSSFLQNDTSLKEWAKDCAVAVNDKIVRDINYKLKDGDKISLLPPVCGG